MFGQAPPAGGQPQATNPFGNMCDCSNMPPVTKALLMVILVGSIVGAFGVAQYTANIPAAVIDSHGAQFYRLLIGQLFGSDIIMAIFASLMICQMGSTIERQRGSIWLISSLITISLLINILWFVILIIIAYSSRTPDIALFPLSGSMPLVIGLMMVEQQYNTLPTRRLMCCPCDIPSRHYPFAFVALMALMSFGTALPTLITGLIAGYIYTSVTWLQLSASRQRQLEATWLCDMLVNTSGFVGVDNASIIDFQPGRSASWANGHSQGNGNNGGSNGPSRANMDGINSNSNNSTGRASVFTSGGGYRLGDGASISQGSASSSSLSSSNGASSNHNSNNVGSVTRGNNARGNNRPGLVLADRMAAATAASRTRPNNNNNRNGNGNTNTNTHHQLQAPAVVASFVTNASLPSSQVLSSLSSTMSNNSDTEPHMVAATAAVRYIHPVPASVPAHHHGDGNGNGDDDNDVFAGIGHVAVTHGAHTNRGDYAAIDHNHNHDDDDDDDNNHHDDDKHSASGARPLLSHGHDH